MAIELEVGKFYFPPNDYAYWIADVDSRGFFVGIDFNEPHAYDLWYKDGSPVPNTDMGITCLPSSVVRQTPTLTHPAHFSINDEARKLLNEMRQLKGPLLRTGKVPDNPVVLANPPELNLDGLEGLCGPGPITIPLTVSVNRYFDGSDGEMYAIFHRTSDSRFLGCRVSDPSWSNVWMFDGKADTRWSGSKNVPDLVGPTSKERVPNELEHTNLVRVISALYPFPIESSTKYQPPESPKSIHRLHHIARVIRNALNEPRRSEDLTKESIISYLIDEFDVTVHAPAAAEIPSSEKPRSEPPTEVDDLITCIKRLKAAAKRVDLKADITLTALDV
jgi:hypothetical protein